MSLFAELRRRNVFKVAAAYVIVGWLVMQIGEVMAPALRLPDWVNSALAFFIILGFPLAIFFAWAFEMTPEGLKLEKHLDSTASISRTTGRKLNYTIIVLLVVALGYFMYTDWLVEPVEMARTDGATIVAPADVGQSIAVLPFQNRSANAENAAFFADGIHDEILTNLSKIGSLKVISRTSVMNYRDTDKNMREIGEELGVATLLEGGVQRAGDQVRINMQLIDAATDEHLWAETYARELSAENIFAIQSEIAQAVAKALHAALSPEEQAALAAVPTRNLAALDHYLLAKQLYLRSNWDDLDQAEEELAAALAMDPEFQQAWELLALVLDNQVNTGSRTLADVQVPWKAAIDRALALNRVSGTANAALAGYLLKTGQPGAEAQSREALALDPHNVEILIHLSLFYRLNGDLPAAWELLQRALELDPMSPRLWHSVGRTHMKLGQPEEAAEAYARIRAIDPASAAGYGPAAGPAIVSGRIAESLRWLFRGWAMDPQDLDLPNWVIRHYVDLGEREAAAAWVADIDSDETDFSFSLAHRAMLAVYGDDRSVAVDLAKAYLADAGRNHRWGSDSTMVNILLMDVAAGGDPASALRLIENNYPELFHANPEVTANNVLQALDAAHLVMLANGENATAAALLREVLAVADTPYALAGDLQSWKVSAKAQALALLGEKDAAIAELQRQVNGGWRLLWHWQTEMNPNLDTLRDHDGYRDIVQFLHQDMARQRDEVRRLVEGGEIPAPPEGAS